MSGHLSRLRQQCGTLQKRVRKLRPGNRWKTDDFPKGWTMKVVETDNHIEVFTENPAALFYWSFDARLAAPLVVTLLDRLWKRDAMVARLRRQLQKMKGASDAQP